MKQFILEHFYEHGMWIVLTYALVVVSMIIDLITGIRKSRKLGRKLNSRGYKRTCRKALDYFLPMTCLACIDMLAPSVTGVPVLTMVFGGYCVFCELKSVMESTCDKAAIRNDVQELMEWGESLGELKNMLHKIIAKEGNHEKD